MKVENMISSKGNKVANQFIIKTTEQVLASGGHIIGAEVVYFQSYKSIIARKCDYWASKIKLDRNKWDCSRTTGKYRNIFLGETKKETEKKIKSGEYILADLN